MSNLQLELLKLFANDIPEHQLKDIKFMLGKYFADQATQLMDDFTAEQGLISIDFEKWSH